LRSDSQPPPMTSRDANSRPGPRLAENWHDVRWSAWSQRESPSLTQEKANLQDHTQRQQQQQQQQKAAPGAPPAFSLGQMMDIMMAMQQKTARPQSAASRVERLGTHSPPHVRFIDDQRAQTASPLRRPLSATVHRVASPSRRPLSSTVHRVVSPSRRPLSATGRVEQQAPVPHRVYEAFKHFDANRSGQLDVHELRNALRHYGVDVSSGDALNVLQRYDDRPNGRLDLVEFAELVRDLELGIVRSGLSSRSSTSGERTVLSGQRLVRSTDGTAAVGGWPTAPDVVVEHPGSAISEPMRRVIEAPPVFAPPPHVLMGGHPHMLPPTVLPARPPMPIPMPTGRSERVPQRVIDSFLHFDANRSGQLDVHELRNALRHYGVDVSSSDAHSVLQRYDDRPNGRLELLEFAELVRDLELGVVRSGPWGHGAMHPGAMHPGAMHPGVAVHPASLQPSATMYHHHPLHASHPMHPPMHPPMYPPLGPHALPPHPFYPSGLPAHPLAPHQAHIAPTVRVNPVPILHRAPRRRVPRRVYDDYDDDDDDDDDDGDSSPRTTSSNSSSAT